jgi:hypothetical protein
MHTDGIIPSAQREGLTERPPLRARSASPPAVRVRFAALRRSLLAVCRALLLGFDPQLPFDQQLCRQRCVSGLAAAVPGPLTHNSPPNPSYGAKPFCW